MSAARLLAKVRDAGVELEVRGDDLAVKAPPGVLTPDRVARIREHKAALLELVKAEAAQPIRKLGRRAVRAVGRRPDVVHGGRGPRRRRQEAGADLAPARAAT